MKVTSIPPVQLSEKSQFLDDTVEFELSRSKAPKVSVGNLQEILSETSWRVFIQIAAINFKLGRQLRCNYNGQPITATVTDDDFIRKVVDQLETVEAGDILECDLLIRQTLKNRKVIASYRISKVFQHKKSLYEVEKIR